MLGTSQKSKNISSILGYLRRRVLERQLRHRLHRWRQHLLLFDIEELQEGIVRTHVEYLTQHRLPNLKRSLKSILYQRVC